MIPVSVVIITKNEAHIIAETIQSVFRAIDQMSKKQFEAVASFVRDDVLEIIALTPWADGFQRLEETRS